MLKSVKKYVEHAKKHGTDQVLETAIEAGLGFDELCELLPALDKLPPHQPKPRFWAPVKHKLTVKTRVRRAMGLDDEEEST